MVCDHGAGAVGGVVFEVAGEVGSIGPGHGSLAVAHASLHLADVGGASFVRVGGVVVRGVWVVETGEGFTVL